MAVVSAALLLTSCAGRAAEEALPPEIKVDAVLGIAEVGGFREGCRAAVFRLSDDVARKIEAHGLAYFQQYGGSDPHGGWRETPGEIDLLQNGHGAKVTFFGLYAMSGCGDRRPPEPYNEVLAEALSRPGSYYLSRGNLEQVIVVAPRKRLVGLYNFG